MKIDPSVRPEVYIFKEKRASNFGKSEKIADFYISFPVFLFVDFDLDHLKSQA